MHIKKFVKEIFVFIVLNVIIEIFVYYFIKLPRLAHYINNIQFFKTDIGSSLLWGYLQIVPLIIPIIIIFLYIGIYKKENSIVYLKLNNALCHYSIIVGGIFASVIMFFIFAIEKVCALCKITKSDKCNILLLIVFFLGYIIQALKEELLYRGILFQGLMEKNNYIIAMIISSAFFSISHWGNRGFSLLAGTNLFLFGVVACMLLKKSDCIWGIVSFHCLWNYLQGYVGGVEISGIEPETSIFTIKFLSNNSFLTGGLFGVEGSIFCTGCLLISIFILFWDERRTNHYEE